MKKNYRCGYLDFPKDKLDHLRRKNEKKIKDKEIRTAETYIPSNESTHDNTRENTTVPPAFSPPKNHMSRHDSISSEVNQNTYPTDSSDMNVNTYPTTSEAISSEFSRNYNAESTNPPDIFASVSPLNLNFFDNDFYLTRENLRIAVYKDSFKKLSNYENNPSHGNNNHLQNTTLDHDLSFDDNDSSSSGSFENARLTLNRHIDSINHIREHLTPASIKHDFNSTIKQEVDSTTINHELNSLNIKQEMDASGFVFTHSHITDVPTINPGNYLTNATFQPYTTTKIKVSPKLKNRFLSRYLKSYQHNLKKLRNKEFHFIHIPVWNDEINEMFWVSVFNQSVLIDVYFSFFLDRSLNLLLRECSNTVAAQDSLRQISGIEEYEWTTFTKRDLDVLTKKSYSYYGNMISKIRESLTDIHLEYPTKISLYAAWSTFFQSQTCINTLSLMYNGTASLLHKIVLDSPTADSISRTIKVTLEAFDNSVTTCLMPDYNFGIIEELYKDILDLKYFVIHNQDLVISKNPLHLQSSLQLELFLKKLIEETYPKITGINNYYKTMKNCMDHTNNIKFTSPNLFFEMVVSWFDILPSEMYSVGSDICPLKKVLYLLFHAVGKAMLHCFTPIRSLLIIDPVNVIGSRVDFGYGVYDILRSQVNSSTQHEYLKKLSTKLLRIILFFNARTSIMAFAMMEKSALKYSNNECYIKTLDTNIPPPPNVHHTDIIEIRPYKVETHEEMMVNFSIDNTITLHNYPLLTYLHTWVDEFSQDTLLNLVQSEVYRSNKVENGGSFNYESGLFVRDYNPYEPLRFFQDYQQNNLSIAMLLMEDIQLMTVNFELSRRELSKCTKHLPPS